MGSSEVLNTNTSSWPASQDPSAVGEVGPTPSRELVYLCPLTLKSFARTNLHFKRDAKSASWLLMCGGTHFKATKLAFHQTHGIVPRAIAFQASMAKRICARV